MVTYFAAQLGISLSVVDSRANYHARKEAEQAKTSNSRHSLEPAHLLRDNRTKSCLDLK